MKGLASAVSMGSAESRSGAYVIETFCEGFLYSCSAFLVDGKISRAFYVREGSSANPYAVDTSYVDVGFGGAARFQIEDGLQRLAAHLQLTDGLLHAQFIMGDGGAYLVELTRRCPGDLYSLLIEFSTGFPYAQYYATFFSSGPTPAAGALDRHVLRHTVTADAMGIFNGLRFIQAEPVLGFYPLLPVGESLLPQQRNRAGLLFAHYACLDDMHAAFARFMSRSAYAVT